MVDIDAREVRSFDVKKKERELVTLYSAVVEPMSVVAVHSVRQPEGRFVMTSLYNTHVHVHVYTPVPAFTSYTHTHTHTHTHY